MRFLILISTIALFCSCSDDNELSDTIVGSWRLSSLGINSCPDSSDNVATANADAAGCLTLNGTMVCQNVIFNANGTGVNTSITDGVTMSQDITYTVNNENNSVTTCDDNNNCNTFSVDGGSFSLSLPFGDCTINSNYVQ